MTPGADHAARSAASPLNGFLGYCDVVVIRLLRAKNPNFDLLRNAAHAFHPPRDALGCLFFGVRAHMAGKGDDAVVDCNADFGGIDA